LFYYRIDEANAGHYRKQNIIVTGADFVFPAPSELKKLMAAFAGEIPTLRAEKHPIEFAVLLHTRLITIHPFVNLLSNMVWESQRDYPRLLQRLERP
jgi:Fic family protein